MSPSPGRVRDRQLGARRVCPPCSRRYATLVDPACPVCAGTGTLTLGEPALHQHAPAVVSRAVDLYLEQAAAGRTDLDRADVLALAVDELRYAGVLAALPDVDEHPPAPAPALAAAGRS